MDILNSKISMPFKHCMQKALDILSLLQANVFLSVVAGMLVLQSVVYSNNPVILTYHHDSHKPYQSGSAMWYMISYQYISTNIGTILWNSRMGAIHQASMVSHGATVR